MSDIMKFILFEKEKTLFKAEFKSPYSILQNKKVIY